MASEVAKKTVAYKDTTGEVEWGTPQPIFDALSERFGFSLDVCASEWNHKCARYFTKQDDGLSQDWGAETCWMNPPYGRGEIDRWMAKALDASRKGALVVCLVPASTDTAWWHDYAAKGDVEFLRGRVKFIRPDGTPSPGSPAFGSAVVVFRPPSSLSWGIERRMPT
ncbi:MAG: DNA N-6-adenine-methyltransferase [Sulfobacillus sp.]